MDDQVRPGFGVFGSAILLIGFLTWTAMISIAQSSSRSNPSTHAIASASDSQRAIEEIVREIDDPATGDRWLLKRNAQDSAGPGRMVLLARKNTLPAPAVNSAGSARGGVEAGDSLALFRAGDHLIVEQHTRLIDAVLDAIALSPAREGESFRARLSIGGRVVKAIAVAPGHAILLPDSGARP